MRPLTLTLKGFRGIRDGLGLNALTLDFEKLAGDAQLVALVGANGRGKSTIMENMTPFLTMPSRAAVAGPGGFSYYDHVFLPENTKDLIWVHEGRRYRSQIVIRLNGRRRTEAFLHIVDERGFWQPVRLNDGTVSDGKVDTYSRCVESICGSPETFFTSVFSAQGKRPLSAYRNAEIKTLLADLLGQEEIRALGQKASETARLLKSGLMLIRQELAGLDIDGERLRGERLRLDGAAERVTRCEATRHEAQRAVEVAHASHACLSVEREQSRGIEVRRSQLLAERKSLVDGDVQAQRTLQAQDHGECERLERLDQRIANRLQREHTRRQALVQSRQRNLDTLADARAVQWATVRLPLAERVLSHRLTLTRACRDQTNALVQCQAAERLAEQKLADIERDAGKAALKAEELAHRFGLAGEVPCAGTDLQGQCKLLGDAYEAQALVPSAKAEIARLARQKLAAQGELAVAQQQREVLAGASQALAWAEHREAMARDRGAKLSALAAKAQMCAQARTVLADIDQELAAMGPGDAECKGVEVAEEQAERRQIATSQRMIAKQLEQHAQQSSTALARLASTLAALPPPYDEQGLAASAQALASARAALATAEQSHLAAVRDAQSLDALSRQVAALAERRSLIDARREQVENELGNWNLFARCMSNDGLIALAIDDAGPALSALANDLLLACYGPRFTVSIHTLLETGKGEQKEGFDIVVHDGETGESKSVTWISGGEKNIVESCLTRAIALYLAQHSGRQYTTLFSDEADGALDPERKRMFMAMKREVLRLGGYAQEYFISQTPELTAMADAMIDLDRLCWLASDQANEVAALAEA